MRYSLIARVVTILVILAFLITGCTQQAPPAPPATKATPPPAAPTTPPPATTPTSPPPAATPPPATTAKVVDWNLNVTFVDRHHVATTLKWFATELEKRTGGRIKVSVHTAGSLGTSTEALENLRKGLSDISNFSSYTAAVGVYPLWEVTMLPGLVPNAAAVNYITWDLYRRGYLSSGTQKIEGIKLLAVTGVEELWVFTTKKRVTTLEDYKGLTIDMSGIWRTKAMQKLGIVGQNIPQADRYSALQRGIVDGTYYGVGMITSLKLWEVVKYGQIAPFGQAPIKIAINEGAFNKLAPDLQAIVLDLSRDLNYVLVDGFLEEQENGLKLVKQNGVDMYALAPGEWNRIVEKLSPVYDEWTKELEAKGLPATEVLNVVKLDLKKMGY